MKAKPVLLGSLFFLLVGICLLYVAKEKPFWIDSIYVDQVYPFLFTSREWFFSALPFSIGDSLYACLMVWFVIQVKGLLGKQWKQSLLLLMLSITILFFWFQLSWGLNYYRTPIGQQLSVEQKYTEEELVELTSFFATKSNQLHEQLSQNDSLAIQYNDNTAALIKRMELAFSPSDKVGKVKISLYSFPLSYMGFSGYLNPFTLEAQVNGRIPKINLPVTIAHEMAHQQGYAAENEANFIGFLSAYNHPDSDIQYAASLFGFRYCYAELRKANPSKAKEIAQRLRPGIFANFAESTTFWKAHKNPFEPLFKKSYDTYLKANSQANGIQSYNQVVSLLLQQFNVEGNFRSFEK